MFGLCTKKSRPENIFERMSSSCLPHVPHGRCYLLYRTSIGIPVLLLFLHRCTTLFSYRCSLYLSTKLKYVHCISMKSIEVVLCTLGEDLPVGFSLPVIDFLSMWINLTVMRSEKNSSRVRENASQLLGPFAPTSHFWPFHYKKKLTKLKAFKWIKLKRQRFSDEIRQPAKIPNQAEFSFAPGFHVWVTHHTIFIRIPKKEQIQKRLDCIMHALPTTFLLPTTSLFATLITIKSWKGSLPTQVPKPNSYYKSIINKESSTF